MKRVFQAVAVTAAVAFFAAPAGATPLVPGASTNNITSVTESGTIIDTLQSTFHYGTGANAVSGVFREVVVATGPNGTGPLDFLYQVAVTSKGTGASGMLNMFSVSGFGGLSSVNVGQTGSVGGLDDQGIFTSPLKAGTNGVMAASRSPGLGDLLNFFAPTGAGKSSFVAVVKTNATAVSLAPGTASFDGNTLTFNTFVPSASAAIAAVPEPVTMVLWGGGFAGLACVGTLRRRKADARA